MIPESKDYNSFHRFYYMGLKMHGPLLSRREKEEEFLRTENFQASSVVLFEFEYRGLQCSCWQLLSPNLAPIPRPEPS